MKATRKLIPAVVLLLVSAMMFSTASYAWFANTTTVNVTGVTLQAQAPTNLYVRRSGDTAPADWKFNKDESSLNFETKKLTPTAPYMDGSAIKWLTADGETFENGTLKAGTIVDLGSITPTVDSTEGYNGISYGTHVQTSVTPNVTRTVFVKIDYEFYFRTLEESDTYSLFLKSIQYNNTATDDGNFLRSVHVLAVGDDGKVEAGLKDTAKATKYEYKYNMATYASGNYTKGSYTAVADTNKLSEVVLDNAITKSADGTDIDGTTKVATKVSLYFFFCGDEEGVTSEDFVKEATQISVEFGVKKNA